MPGVHGFDPQPHVSDVQAGFFEKVVVISSSMVYECSDSFPSKDSKSPPPPPAGTAGPKLTIFGLGSPGFFSFSDKLGPCTWQQASPFCLFSLLLRVAEVGRAAAWNRSKGKDLLPADPVDLRHPSPFSI